jgi:hypothetical protein
MSTKLWQGTLKGRDHSEQIEVDEKIILKWILEKYGLRVWTGFVWLRIRAGGGLL